MSTRMAHGFRVSRHSKLGGEPSRTLAAQVHQIHEMGYERYLSQQVAEKD